MQNKCELHTGLRTESERRTRIRDALIRGGAKRDLVADEILEPGPLPGAGCKERVGSGERINAAVEGTNETLRILRTQQGLARYRLHGRQRILDAMVQLREEQPVQAFGSLALADVAGNLRCPDD